MKMDKVITDTRRSEDAPMERMTRLCAAMTAALEANPEHTPTVKAVVLLMDGKTGGLQLHNYASDDEALVDLMVHVQALCETRGLTLTVNR